MNAREAERLDHAPRLSLASPATPNCPDNQLLAASPPGRSGHSLADRLGFVRPIRTATVLALSGLALLTACSGSLGTGGAPTTTEEPWPTEDMCVLGRNVFLDIDELDRKEPDYLDEVKKAVDRLDDRAPAEIADDMRAFVTYVEEATDKSELEALPDHVLVSTGRIDEWWQDNCGGTLIGGG
jgi:hypothetical protein